MFQFCKPEKKFKEKGRRNSLPGCWLLIQSLWISKLNLFSRKKKLFQGANKFEFKPDNPIIWLASFIDWASNSNLACKRETTLIASRSSLPLPSPRQLAGANCRQTQLINLRIATREATLSSQTLKVELAKQTPLSSPAANHVNDWLLNELSS